MRVGRHHSRVALVGALVLASLLVPGGTLARDKPRAAPTPLPDEQAANGPLVGDPSLLPGEATCVAQEGNAPWYATIAAFEVHDSARTHLYGCAHFGGAMNGPNQVFAYVSPDTFVTPYNLVGAGPDQLFVYGGGYGDSPTASGSFVSAVEPGSLRERWRRVLINTNVTDEWDYPGVLNVMDDGALVVVYGYHIARLDPATGAVEATAELPTGDSAPRDTAYNGFVALPDGTLIAKTVNRQPGCEEQGFSAFLDCPDPASAPVSVLVAIDPKTLEVLAQATLPEMMGGRVTTSVYEGTDYIYLPGTANLYRYTYADGAFAVDPTWGPVPYLLPGQTAGSGMAVIGDHVALTTNGASPTSTPLSLVVVSQADSSQVMNLQPFADSGAKQSFIPSMVTVDPAADRIYLMDAGAGKVGAVQIGDDGLSVAWTADQTTLSFLTLVGPDDARVLIGTDIPVKSLKQLQSYQTEQVVWRDAATGTELARSDQLPKMTPGILVTPGFAGLQYFLSLEGDIRALQVAPAVVEASAAPQG